MSAVSAESNVHPNVPVVYNEVDCGYKRVSSSKREEFTVPGDYRFVLR